MTMLPRVSALIALPFLGLVSLHAQTGQIAGPRPVLPARDNAARPTGTARLRGRITDTSDQPLRRAVVTIAATDVNVRRVITTDEDGRYEFADLPAARYTVSASKGSYVTLQYGQRRPFEPGRPVPSPTTVCSNASTS